MLASPPLFREYRESKKPCPTWTAALWLPCERTPLPTAFIPFTMHASAREDHRRTFRTDIERLTAGHLRGAPMDVLRSTDTQAVFRGAVPKGAHTATDAGLARYLEGRLATDDINLDLRVTMER
jgi:hypothetical protein